MHALVKISCWKMTVDQINANKYIAVLKNVIIACVYKRKLLNVWIFVVLFLSMQCNLKTDKEIQQMNVHTTVHDFKLIVLNFPLPMLLFILIKYIMIFFSQILNITFLILFYIVVLLNFQIIFIYYIICYFLCISNSEVMWRYFAAFLLFLLWMSALFIFNVFWSLLSWTMFCNFFLLLSLLLLLFSFVFKWFWCFFFSRFLFFY